MGSRGRFAPKAVGRQIWPQPSAIRGDRGVSAIDQRASERSSSERQFQLQVDTVPTLNASVLLALLSYFATRIRPTCTNRSARGISWRQANKQRKQRTLWGLKSGVKHQKISIESEGYGGESVSQSPLMYKLFFVPARGNQRSWLPAHWLSRAPAAPQAAASSSVGLDAAADQAISTSGGGARKR